MKTPLKELTLKELKLIRKRINKKTGLIRHFSFKPDAKKKQNTCALGACMDVRGIAENGDISIPEHDALEECGLLDILGGNTESGFFLARNNDHFIGTPEERKEYIIAFIESEIKKRTDSHVGFFHRMFGRKLKARRKIIIERVGNYTTTVRFGVLEEKKRLEKESTNDHVKWRIQPFINN